MCSKEMYNVSFQNSYLVKLVFLDAYNVDLLYFSTLNSKALTYCLISMRLIIKGLLTNLDKLNKSE